MLFWGDYSLNSTTGSHVKDPKKESRKNRKKVPVLTIEALEEIVSVLITAENVTPKKYLGSLTPNEFLMNSLKTSPLWLNFNCSYSNKNQFVTSEKVFVRCNEKNNESPHVNFLTLKYRGPGIVRPELVNKQIIAKYDYRDIREIEVTTLTGKPLGKLRAAKSWQLCPLSITTLNNINKLIKNKRLSMKDPLSGYLEHLLENKHLPSQALELYRLFDQVKIAGEASNSQDEISIVTEQNTAITAKDTDEESDEDIDIPEWTPELIFKDE